MRRATTGTAYLLWALGMFGICGLQRFYAGQTVLGVVYLFTFGFFGIGQILDVVLIPGMIKTRNNQLRGKYLAEWADEGLLVPVMVSAQADGTVLRVPSTTPAAPAPNPMQHLLKIAQDHGGQLSKAQVALHTGLSPKAVDDLLHEAMVTGYATVTNDPETGAVRYLFDV